MSDPDNPRTDTLSDRDLEGISDAVANGILRAASQQDIAQHGRQRIIGAGYLIATILMIGLVSWGWNHRPSQTVVLNGRFLADAEITAVLSPLEPTSSQQASFILRLDGVEEILQLQRLLLPTQLVLPIGENEIQDHVGEIRNLAFAKPEEAGAEGQNISAPVSVFVSASGVKEVTLSKQSQRGQSITKISVAATANERDLAIVTIEVIPEPDRIVRVTGELGEASVLLGTHDVPFNLPVAPTQISSDQLVYSSFNTRSGSEFPGLRFEATVSKLTLSGTEGFFDVGQTRVPLVSSDKFVLEFLETESFGVEIVDEKIGLGTAAVATSIKRGETQLLRRQIEVNPIYRNIVTALGAALLGMFSSVLPALRTLFNSVFRTRHL